MADLASRAKHLWGRFHTWGKEKLFATVIAGLCMLFIGLYVNTRSPHLYHQVGEIFPFKTDGGGFSHFQILIANDGSAMAETVDCELELDEFKFLEVMASPSFLKPKVTVQPNQRIASIELPRLNATEKLEVFIKTDAVSKERLRQALSIQLRGKDIIGDRVPIHKTWFREMLSFLISSGMMALTVYVFILIGFKQGKERGIEEGKEAMIRHLLRHVADLLNTTETKVMQAVFDFAKQLSERMTTDEVKEVRFTIFWPQDEKKNLESKPNENQPPTT